MQKRPERFATILLLLISILLSTVTVAAQPQTSDWSRLTSVAAGSKLAVKLRNGKTIDGTLNSVSETTLSLRVKNAPVELKRDDVVTVHEVTRKSATKATLIGLGVGAGAGAAVGAIGDANDDSGIEFDKLDRAVVAGLAIVGAGAGALAGFLIGRNGKKRVLLYEAK